ncbi:hypothetical protein PPERSA_00118 [Pseudocohnilembus persalinus]|uniref:Transmembrane protein n=1 Tax=Pseudocohnilembus persalinus TaxID=266149 RepID=A0A0V0Q8G7_PSEPJ|nr:hypothetical protein PPERSA_00118 [Pseudocohnilembus persalinus]|eukprot:KRW98521.1 hypothetical protein PPERSA_00118 [Pseudocohnilembus persalinus]
MQQISQKVEQFSQKNKTTSNKQRNPETNSELYNSENVNSNYIRQQQNMNNSKIKEKEEEIEILKIETGLFYDKIAFYKCIQYIAAILIAILAITLLSFTLYLNNTDHQMRRIYGFGLSGISIILAIGLVTLNYKFEVVPGFVYVVSSIILGIGSLFLSVFMNISRFYQDKNDDVQPIIEPHTDDWYTIDHIATWIFDIIPLVILLTSAISLVQLQKAQKIKQSYERIYLLKNDIDRELNEPLINSGETKMSYQQEFMEEKQDHLSRTSTNNAIELQNSIQSSQNNINNIHNPNNSRKRQVSDSNIKISQVKNENQKQNSNYTSNNYNRTTEVSRKTEYAPNKSTNNNNNINKEKPINDKSNIITNNTSNMNKTPQSSISQDNYSNLKYIQQQKNANNSSSINDDQIFLKNKINKRSDDITEQIHNTYVAYDKKLKEVSVSFVGQTDSSQNNDNSPLKISQNVKYQKSNSSARPFQGKLKFTQSSSEFQIKNGQLFDSVYEESGEHNHLGGPHINDLIGKKNQSRLQEFNEDLEFESSYD